jgi:hypothetical protein
METERRPQQISHFTRKTDISSEYGERTWRPVQSIIDLVQNHLDANTTTYEKKLLKLVGKQDYDPSNKDQQQTISLMNTIKYSQDQEEVKQAFSSLPAASNIQDINQLREQLDGINYQKPNMMLKASNGQTTQLVRYDDVKDLPEEWQVIGFSIKDEGSGFDDQLLGMMGASTKKESTGKRGGLGEGLKMSVAHLLRAGADIKLASLNPDSSWTAQPQIIEGKIAFKGVKRQEAGVEFTGSLTHVDFRKATFDEKSREEIVTTLDPRKGEGLGKYVLEFRGDDFIPLINSSNEIASHGVPAGRIYVKGLLVKEKADLVYSYNLGDKWAIEGRDRKNVQQNDLLEETKKAISSISKAEKLTPLVSAIAQKGSQLELKVIDPSLQLGEEQAQAWRDSLKEVFDFEAGNTLFAPDYLSSDRQRLLEEQGYKVILIPPERNKATALFEKLYDGEIVSSRHFFEQHEAQTTTGLIEQDTTVSEKAEEKLTDLKADFMWMLLDSKITRNNRLNFKNLQGLKFAVAKKTNADPNSSPFEYNRARNTIYVGDTDLNSFQAQVDLYAEMIKTAVSKEVFDTATQDILTQLAGKAVVKLRPELLEQYTPIHLNGNTEFQEPVTYTDVERAQDAALADFLSYLRVVNTPNVSQDEVRAALAKMKEYEDKEDEPNLAQVKKILSNGITNHLNSIFYFDGKLYQADPYTFLIYEKLLIGKGESADESGIPPTELLPAGKDQYILEANTDYYLPYRLQDGESMQLKFAGEEKDAYILIKRRGNKIFTKRGNEETTDIIPLGHKKNLTGKYNFHDDTFAVYNNVININSNRNYGVKIETNSPSSTAQLPEKNQGKDFIDTKITIDYGGEVWRDQKRILLDALQNHIDAQNGEIPNLSFTVTGSDGKITKVSQIELSELGNEYRIVGVSIQDQGKGYTTPYLSSLGASTKGDEDIGKFGEGLKMLTASAVRQGINVELSSRNWKAKPTSYETTVRDYETGRNKIFTMLGYQMDWTDNNQVGSSTEFSVLPSTLEAGQQSLSEVQLSEREKTWQEWMSVVDPRHTNQYGQRGLDRFIAPKEEDIHTDGIVKVINSQPGRIFEKGLFIPNQATTQPMMFGYDLDESIIDTRERNAYNEGLLDNYLKEYYSNLTDKDLIKRIVEKVKANPDTDFYEYKFFSFSYFPSPKTGALWRQAFYETYGDDAVLSLKPGVQSLYKHYASYIPELKRAVTDEVHLENHNLVTLPENLTLFYKNLVYNSQNFLKDFESADAHLPPADQQQLTSLVHGVNSVLAEIIDEYEANPAKAVVLRKFTSVQELQEQKDSMLNMTKNSVIVKSKAFPVSGMVEEKNGHAIVYLNQNVLHNPDQLVDIYNHELAHFLSRQNDYKLDFQRFLMMVALHNPDLVS